VPVAQVVSMKQLLESGVHFGHQTRRWNPKMKRYIFTERNGIYIIDLQQSLDYIDRAYEFIKETVAHGGTILYVGTKKQAQEAIAEQARRVGMPFVNQRWLGGMLTNFSTVYKRLQRLKELEEIDFGDVAGSGMTKKELLHLRREHDKLDRTLGGIRDMARVPSAIWVVDTKKEHIAVNEARKLGIPVVAILDTNCDPDEVNYPIPGNDDAIRSVALLTRVVADAVAEGLIARAGAANTDEKPSGNQIGTEEPLAEWERELLQGSATEATEATEATGAAGAAGADGAAAATGTNGSADATARNGRTARTESAAATVTPPDAAIVAAAEAEGPADLEINAESVPGSEADAAADQADDLAGLAEAADETAGDEAAATADAATDDAATAAAADAVAAREVAADAAAAADEGSADDAPLTETIGEITDATTVDETTADATATTDATNE
jgi:small subunit ribosomal protein S2